MSIKTQKGQGALHVHYSYNMALISGLLTPCTDMHIFCYKGSSL